MTVNETTRIACLHAHHGNIGYIDDLLLPYRTDVSHFVDPALVRRIGVDQGFGTERAAERVRGQLRWIAESGVSGIVVTCTAYAAAMPPPDELGVTIPIVTIDEPFFAAVCRARGPQRILFTNPGTVEGTMGRLAAYADRHAIAISATSALIPGAFDLFMAGRQADHDALLIDRLPDYAREATHGSLFVGQLSMSAAARKVDRLTGVHMVSPLDTLESAIVDQLGIVR